MDLAHYFDFRGRPKFQRATIFSNTRHPRCASARPHRGAMQRVVTVTNFADASLVKRHLSYLQREGKGLDGAKPELFSRTDDTEISKEPLPEEERFYRVILSPDNGNDLDMKAYTRAFMDEMENRTGQKYEWAAAVHYNTEHAHAHICIRGITRDGQETYLHPDLIKHDMRQMASEIATNALGYRTQLEIQQSREKEITAERVTSLDKAIAGRVNSETNRVMPQNEREKKRLEYLEQIGLAKQEHSTSIIKTHPYTMTENWQKKLRSISEQNDIIKRVHKDLDSLKHDNPELQSKQLYVVRKDWSVEGKVVLKDIDKEAFDKPYILVESKNKLYFFAPRNGLENIHENDRVRIQNGNLTNLEKDREATPNHKQNRNYPYEKESPRHHDSGIHGPHDGIKHEKQQPHEQPRNTGINQPGSKGPAENRRNDDLEL